MQERAVEVLPVEKLGGVYVQDDGAVVVTVHNGDREFGLLLQPHDAEELTGALIERPHTGFATLGSAGSSERHVDVADHSVETASGDAFVVQLRSEDGPTLTFRLGHRRAVRIRDQLSAMIARHTSRSRQ